MKNTQIISFMLLLFLVAGCSGTTDSVDSGLSGKYEFSRARKMVMVQIKGNPKAANLFAEFFEDQLEDVGAWKFENRLEQNIKIYPKAANLYVAGADVAADEVFLRIDLGDWNVQNMSAITGDGKDSKVFTTNIQFHATCIGHGDTKIIDRGLYSGSAFIDKSLGAAEAARINSLKNAIKEFVSEVTPVKDRYETALHISGDEMKPIEKLVEDGKTAEARTELEKLLAKDKNRSDILYNIAVTYDLEGRFRKALYFYDNALLNLKEDNTRYEKAKAECARKFVIESSK
ncbi:MAG: tetratricopeptide repeat protein [Planctomycetota bacterium]|jgi:tetratricopeptide (TPR) repeat protein